MNIDGTKLSDLYNNTVNKKNASAQTGSTGFVSGVEAFFDDEKEIKRAENLSDAYDRRNENLISRPDLDKNGDKALSSEVIQELADLVTPEDFSKYEEWGLAPDKDEPGNILTVSERIEIHLAMYCEDYKPVGNISSADIKSMYGETMAYQIENAVNKASNMDKISRSETEYLVTNGLNLTVDNVYKAKYSVNNAGSGQYQHLSEIQWNELKPQVEKVLNQCGLDVNNTNLENGKWLIEEKIPVTAENLHKLSQIDEINANIDKGISEDEWRKNIISNVELGINPLDTSANFYHTAANDVIIANEIITNGSEQQIEALVMDGKDVTLLNMKRAGEDSSIKAMSQRKEALNKEQKQRVQENYRYLEEIRLKMTVESSAVMVKNGINIDITPLSELVDELKRLENEYVEMFFSSIESEKNGRMMGTVSAAEKMMFLDTKEQMEAFYNTPAYTLGTVAKAEAEFNVKAIVQSGEGIKASLKNASMAYEILGTRPDKALGDSLSKAFAGIEGMLSENAMEYSEENARAVRILAYNQMEITRENISEIKALDIEVTRLFENLTPKTTAYLIANGINPLETDIRRLNEELDRINRELNVDEVEKYSEYLWKIEKNGKISKEDRDAYIGIYRLINMVEKGDRRAVGALSKQGMDLNMRNLLTVMRSLKSTGKDVRVDDELGLAEEVKLSDTNIDLQLSLFETSAFLKRAARNISPERIKNLSEKKNINEMSFNEFVEDIAEDFEAYEEERVVYNELRCQEINDAVKISEDALKYIMEDGGQKNMENIINISYYMMNRRETISKMKKLCDTEMVDEDVEDIKSIFENDGEASELIEKTEKLAEDVKESLLSKNRIDISDLRSVYRMSDYMTKAAKNNSFYIPVDIDGEEVTLKVTLRSEKGEAGKVNVRLDGEEGVIEGEFTLKNKEVKAFIMAVGNENERIRNCENIFADELGKKGLELRFYSVSEEKYNSSSLAENTVGEAGSGSLFNIAKAFVTSIKK